MRRFSDKYNAQLSHEARHGLKTARIDLAAFVALDSETRRARWRGFSHDDKADVVIQRLNQLDGEWSDERVERAIAHYDQKWGAEPTATEAAVAGALERLEAEHQQQAETARRAGERKDAAFFQRAANAYCQARKEWRAGLRPVLQEGVYLLPSRSDGPAHRIVKDGDWRCMTCKAGAAMHWATALIIGMEQGADDLDRYDDYTPDYDLTPAQLGTRLAQARARLMEAA